MLKELSLHGKRAAGRAQECQRRPIGANAAGNVAIPLPDLLTVPGIGPQNIEKLVSKGIAKLAELKQLYLDKFLQDGSEKMVEYLRSSVGIWHKNHAESITNFIKHTVDAELGPKEDCPPVKKCLTFCVEGNISVESSHFCRKLQVKPLSFRTWLRLFLSQLQSGKMWGMSITISWSLFMQSLSDMRTHSRTMSLLHVSCRSVNLQMG